MMWRLRLGTYLTPVAAMGGAWSPASLFAASEVGAWFDPSDLTSMFQDAAGTTPCAVNSVVGLVMDKSKGLALGVDIVTNGDFSSGTGWAVTAGVAVSGGKLNFTAAANGSDVRQTSKLTVGNWYKVTYTIDSISGMVRFFDSAVTGANHTTAGTYTEYFKATNTTLGFQCSGVTTAVIDDLTVKHLAGNHASQATTASKPILRQSGALYYLEFDGVDDGLATAAINFTATDEMSVFAGVRKTSGFGFQALTELGTGIVENGFSIFAPSNLNNDYDFRLAANPRNSATTFAPPIKNILQVSHDISQTTAATETVARINGGAITHSGSVTCAGMFINAPLYIGRRGGASLPFSGHLYGLIVRGKTTVAADITSTETYLNDKTGAY